MKLLSKEDVEEKLKGYYFLNEQAWNLLKWYHEEIEEVSSINYFDTVEIKDGYINFEGDEYLDNRCGRGSWGYGSRQHYCFSLPINLLYDPSARKELKKNGPTILKNV